MLAPADTQRVGDPIDVVEPRGDQRDLKDSFIVKPGGAQAIVVPRRDARGVARDLHDVIQHYFFLLRDRRRSVVFFQRRYQVLVQSHSTQKLCVRFDSIMTPVGHRDHRRDHLMLPSR